MGRRTSAAKVRAGRLDAGFPKEAVSQTFSVRQTGPIRRSRVRQRGRSRWVSRSEGRDGLGCGALSGPCGRYLVTVELQQIVGGGD